MGDKVIIGLVGTIKAGKTLTTRYFKEHYNAAVYRFSHILGDVLDILCLPQSRENLQNVAIALRKEFGSNILVPALERKIGLANASIVVVDGIRVWSEAEMVKKMGGFVIYITASNEVRFKRLQSAEKVGEELQTFDQFLKSQQKENELLISEIGQSADYTINNNTDKDNLIEQLNKIASKEVFKC